MTKLWAFLFAIVPLISFFSFGECQAQSSKAKSQSSQKSPATPAKGKIAPLSTQKVASVQTILDEIPKDSQPLSADDEEGMFARDRANKWLGQNIIGKTVTFSDRIDNVTISPEKKLGEYRSGVLLAGFHGEWIRTFGIDETSGMKMKGIQVGTVRSGDAEWNVEISCNLNETNIDEARSRQFLQLKGKTVTITGQVEKAGSKLFYLFRGPGMGKKNQLRMLQLSLSNASIEGIDSTDK